MYTYKAKILRVVDGDTFDAQVDLGFSMTAEHRFRVAHIDTPESWRPKSEAEREHGNRATERAKELLEGKTLTMKTYSLGIYGRYSASIQTEELKSDDTPWDFAELMIAEGFEKKSREEYELETVESGH